MRTVLGPLLYQGGTGSVRRGGSYERDYDLWMNDLINRFRARGRESIPGPQFSPKDVPEGYGPAGELYYDPEVGSEDEYFMAARGTPNVPPRNTDTVNAKLTPREAVLNRNAAELAGRGYIRHLNNMGNELARRGVDLAARGRYQRGIEDILGPLLAAKGITEVKYPTLEQPPKQPPKQPPLYKLPPPPRATPVHFPRTAPMRLQEGTDEVWTPEQLEIVKRIRSGQEDYTFGPGSPNPTKEDLGTYVGGPHSPAGGFAVHGGVALPKSEFYLFSDAQRRQLGIMDIAPDDQAGKIERYYSAPGSATSGVFAGVPGGQNLSQMSTMTDYQIMQEQAKQKREDLGSIIAKGISDLGTDIGNVAQQGSAAAQSMLSRMQTGASSDPLAPLRIIQPIQPWGS